MLEIILLMVTILLFLGLIFWFLNWVTKGFLWVAIKIKLNGAGRRLVIVKASTREKYYSIGKFVKPNVLFVTLRNKNKVHLDLSLENLKDSTIEEEGIIKTFVEYDPFYKFLGFETVDINEMGVVIFPNGNGVSGVNIKEYENLIDEALTLNKEDKTNLMFYLMLGVALIVLVIAWFVLQNYNYLTVIANSAAGGVV